MPLELVLNELSLRAAAPTVLDARQRMADFVETVRQATKRRASRVLRTDRDLNDIELAPSYPVRRWLNDSDVDLDTRRAFRALASKAPYLGDLPLIQDRAQGMDCLFQKTSAYGLLTAYLVDGLAVSLRSDESWDSAFVQICVQQLDEHGELEITDEILRHASSGSHIATDHAPWIDARCRFADPRDGVELWSQCSERYPLLHFCEHIGDHLSRYGAGAEELAQIMKRLSELQRYAAGWAQGRFESEVIGSKITPESPETLKRYARERTFLCPDGAERVFSWHARFTPGAGRLYFYPDEEARTITIGYIGGHLPTIRF